MGFRLRRRPAATVASKWKANAPGVSGIPPVAKESASAELCAREWIANIQGRGRPTARPPPRPNSSRLLVPCPHAVPSRLTNPTPSRRTGSVSGNRTPTTDSVTPTQRHPLATARHRRARVGGSSVAIQGRRPTHGLQTSGILRWFRWVPTGRSPTRIQGPPWLMESNRECPVFNPGAPAARPSPAPGQRSGLAHPRFLQGLKWRANPWFTFGYQGWTALSGLTSARRGNRGRCQAGMGGAQPSDGGRWVPCLIETMCKRNEPRNGSGSVCRPRALTRRWRCRMPGAPGQGTRPTAASSPPRPHSQGEPLGSCP